MNMISFEVEITRSGDFSFIDRLVVDLGEVRFGEKGGASEKRLVQGEIEILLTNFEKQQQFPVFLNLLAGKHSQDLFALLEEACWEGGRWDFGPPDAPSNPFIFLALPKATELFDLERAYFVSATGDSARVIFREDQTGLIREVRVSRMEYARIWRSILKRIVEGNREHHQ